jgi:hypothetical protein
MGLVPVVEIAAGEVAETAFGVVHKDRERDAGVAPEVPSVFIADVAHDHLAGIEFLSPVGTGVFFEYVLSIQLGIGAVCMTFMLRVSGAYEQASDQKGRSM